MALGHIAVTLSSTTSAGSDAATASAEVSDTVDASSMKRHENAAILKCLLQWFDQNSVEHNNLLIDQMGRMAIACRNKEDEVYKGIMKKFKEIVREACVVLPQSE